MNTIIDSLDQNIYMVQGDVFSRGFRLLVSADYENDKMSEDGYATSRMLSKVTFSCKALNVSQDCIYDPTNKIWWLSLDSAMTENWTEGVYSYSLVATYASAMNSKFHVIANAELHIEKER